LLLADLTVDCDHCASLVELASSSRADSVELLYAIPPTSLQVAKWIECAAASV
jgi:hypothetical protein